MLSESAGGLVTRCVDCPTGTWLSMMQDGLGSVRGVYSGGVISTQHDINHAAAPNPAL